MFAWSGLLLFVKWGVFSGASGFFVRGLFSGPVTGLLVRAAVFLSTVCWQVEPLICLLCFAALCVFAVCFCFGLVTNPLDCFLIV